MRRPISRKRWGARKPRATTRHRISGRSVLFVHWSAGKGRGIESLSQQKATMRAIQNGHMDDNGWSDVGYSYVVFQPYGKLRRARVFRGRGFKHVPAAQYGWNTGHGAVCVVMRDGEPLKRSTKRLIRAIHRRFEGERLWGHRDVGQTGCPGSKLYAALGEMKAKRKASTRLP